MGRTIPLTAACLLALTGCGAEGESQTPQMDAVQAGEKSPADAAFEDYVLKEGFAETDADLDAVKDLAKSICDAYDQGHSFVTIIETIVDSGGYNGREAGELNGAATAAYCPEHA